jgi:TrkA-C domain
MTAIITLFVIVFFSLLAVRVATTALTMTGLSYDTASFQSYSAFFGVGFTTREAELVVNHPVRRRIIRDLILAGNIGVTSSLATLVATLLQSPNSLHPLWVIAMVTIGIFAVLYFSKIRFVRRTIDYWIQNSLRRAGIVRALDYELLLRIERGYCVSEYVVEDWCPIANKALHDSRPKDYGVVVLAIRRNNEFLPGLPQPNDVILVGDVVTLYGEEHSIQRLFHRKSDSVQAN